MGLRNASVRHPNEVVMAPALTETAQPHNFKLSQKPDAGRLSLSLKKLKTLKEIVGPLSLRDAKPDVSDLGFPDVGMNGHSPSKTTYTINGLSKCGKSEFIPLDKCDPSTVINKPEEHVSPKESTESSSNYTLTHIGGFMMNNSNNSIEDSEVNMGLQKTNQDLSSLSDQEGVSPTKEKMSQGDVDQLFKNLGVVIPDEMPNSGELGQNVDELLQVINNIDGGGDIQTLGSTPSDSESIFRMSGNDIAATLTSFERELFTEVDMMNMCVDDTLVNLNKETVLKDRLEEARKKQFQLKRKCEFLFRRLRKLQSRTLGKHVCDEVTGVLEYTNNIFDASNRSKGHAHVDTGVSDVKCDIKGVSLSNLSVLMRQMEHSAAQQANYLSRNANKQRYFGSGSTSSTTPSNGMRIPGTIIPSFKPEVKKEIQRVTGELEAQLSMVQSEIDSDLTASSSGCDSCDEFVSYSSIPPLQHVPLNKRALWKYSLERGLVASRWTWLQARMVDLEYKIRQTNEIRRQLRLAKGSIRLKPAKQQPANGSVQLDVQPLLSEGGCSRTVGVVGGLRKRRLVRSEGLHLKSKRAGRPTTVKCCCRLGSTPPCLICTGRTDPTSPQDPTLPLNMKLALIDPAYHPQLSLTFDVSQSIHYNAVMKCSDWQSKAGRVKQSSGRMITNSGVVIGAGAAREAVQAVDNEPRRYRVVSSCSVVNPTLTPQLSSSVTSVQSQPDLPTITTSIAPPIGLKRRNHPRGRRRRPLENFKSKQRKSNVSLEGENSRGAIVEPETSFNGGDTIKYLSPIPSPTPSKDQFRRKRENSYDIDNIVIPYCMASSTRPEKLHYKEILTPKWRLIRDDEEEEGELKNGGVRRSSHELEGEEDATEESAVARHERCEEEERKKFLSYLKVNRGGRGQRRTDSRAESSGPNTPGDNQTEAEGESREATQGDVLSPVENSLDSEQSPTRAPSPPPSDQNLTSYMMTRKRTVSSGSSSQPKSPPIPHPEVPPYEPRVFPLSDQVYQKMLQEQKEFQQYPPEERPVYKNCDYDMFLGSDGESSG